LVIFGRDVAERVCYQMMICYPVKHEPWNTLSPTSLPKIS